jgi:hypothetical protein
MWNGIFPLLFCLHYKYTEPALASVGLWFYVGETLVLGVVQTNTIHYAPSTRNTNSQTTYLYSVTIVLCCSFPFSHTPIFGGVSALLAREAVSFIWPKALSSTWWTICNKFVFNVSNSWVAGGACMHACRNVSEDQFPVNFQYMFLWLIRAP